MLCNFAGQEWPESRAPSIRNISLENIDWRKDHVLAPSTQVTLSIEYLKHNNNVLVEYSLYPEALQ